MSAPVIVRHHDDDLFEQASATYSPCEAYRYRLTRQWGEGPMVAYVMLNPSTATEAASDPTVYRCRRRAADTGHGGLIVLNLFALRSTDPAVLGTHPDPVGPLNDQILTGVLAGDVDRVVCAWGASRYVGDRGDTVVAMLRQEGVRPWCLGTTRDGHPRHPLYVPWSQGFEPYDGRDRR